jgi:hypothetical protein
MLGWPTKAWILVVWTMAATLYAEPPRVEELLAYAREHQQAGRLPVIAQRWPDLQGIDLSLLPLDDIDFSHVDLRRARMVGARLLRLRFHQARLDQIIATDALFDGCDLTEASLVAADLRGARFIGCAFFRADLARADLTAVRMRDSDLLQARLVGVRLHGAELSGARHLETVDLTDASGLTMADLASMADRARITEHQLRSYPAERVGYWRERVALLALAVAVLAVLGWLQRRHRLGPHWRIATVTIAVAASIQLATVLLLWWQPPLHGLLAQAMLVIALVALAGSTLALGLAAVEMAKVRVIQQGRRDERALLFGYLIPVWLTSCIALVDLAAWLGSWAFTG